MTAPTKLNKDGGPIFIKIFGPGWPLETTVPRKSRSSIPPSLGSWIVGYHHHPLKISHLPTMLANWKFHSGRWREFQPPKFHFLGPLKTETGVVGTMLEPPTFHFIGTLINKVKTGQSRRAESDVFAKKKKVWGRPHKLISIWLPGNEN